jgi:hypothetical protein
MPRPNPPHVPPTPQRHHLHTNSQTNMLNLPSTKTMPPIRTPIPTSRHARSMGRNDQQTTSSRTKTTRHQSNTTHTRPNVERHPITKQIENHQQKLQWTAATLILTAVCCHAFNLYPIGPAIHLAGATLWVITALPNKEGPILLNFAPQTIIWAAGLLWHYL